MLDSFIQVLPNLKFQGLVVFRGPANKNTRVRLGYA